jgi:hypothetical protein
MTFLAAVIPFDHPDPARATFGGKCCSQKARAKADVLAQNAIVLRYEGSFILTKRAQKNASFSGISICVLAHLQVSRLCRKSSEYSQKKCEIVHMLSFAVPIYLLGLNSPDIVRDFV